MLGRTGQKIGRWKLEHPIGKGGMGQVWSAVSGEQRCAIKLLAVRSTEDEELRRLKREGRALERLQHPNVVRALDVGRAGSSIYYLAMELLEGESLHQRLKRQPMLTVAEAVPIALSVASGLEAVHAAGLIHRDVKPGNVFLCSDGTTKLVDFGLALRLAADPEDTNETRLTEPGVVVGTPGYMAPEQISGGRREDHRVDVWALGALLHRMLSGRRPFYAEGTHIAEMVRITSSEPDPLPPEVPPAVAAVIREALRKRRAKRIQSVARFENDLREAMATPPEDGPLVPWMESNDRVPTVEVSLEAPTKPTDLPGAVLPSMAVDPLPDEVRVVSAVYLVGTGSAESRERAGAAIRAGGGRTSIIRGDQLVGVFGGSNWTGDESLRAVDVALKLRDDALRIGVGTGRAVVRGPAGGEVTGAAVQAAVRASTNAASEERKSPASMDDDALVVDGTGRRVVVGACSETRRRIRGAFDMAGCRVLRLKPGGRPLVTPELSGIHVPLFGREPLLAEVEQELTRRITEARGGSVLLFGPAGIGKSRLIQELQTRLESSKPAWRCVHWRATAGLEPEHVLGRMMAAHGLQLADAVRDRLEDAGEPTALGAVDAVHRHVAAWAGEQPVAILVEDLHRVGTGALRQLEALRRRLYELPVALVLTARPELLSQPDVSLPEAKPVPVPPLSHRDVGRLVETLLGAGASERNAVVQRAAGSPLFAEELCLHLRSRPVGGGDGGSLPDSIAAAFEARVRRLPPELQTALQCAAAVGEIFWEQSLPTLGIADPMGVLPSLRVHEAVLPYGPSALSGCRQWRFRNGIFRDVCLAMSSDDQRRKRHAGVAGWLETAGAPPAWVARQHQAAGEGEHPARGRRHWLAATAAAEAAGNADGAVHAGLAALSHELASSVDGRRATATNLLWLGRLEEAREIMAPAVAAAENAPGTTELRARVWRLHGRISAARGQPFTALEAAIKARTLFEGTGDAEVRERERLGCRMDVARCLVELGAVEEALEMLHEVDATARAIGAVSAQSASGHLLGLATLRHGRDQDAVQLLEASLAASREVNSPSLEAAAAGLLSHCHWGMRAPKAAARLGRAALQSAKAAGGGPLEALARTALAAALRDLGEDNTALNMCTSAHRIRERFGLPLLETHLLLTTYDILLDLGRRSEAEAALDAARETFVERLADVGGSPYADSFQENVPANVRLRALS